MALMSTKVLESHTLLQEIDKDAGLQTLIEAILTYLGYRPPHMVVHGRLLYKNRPVIPKTSQFISIIIKECHGGCTDGHGGPLRTYKSIFSQVFLESMKKIYTALKLHV